MSPFLVRIMTPAHLLSASVHVTSARDPKLEAIVLGLAPYTADVLGNQCVKFEDDIQIGL